MTIELELVKTLWPTEEEKFTKEPDSTIRTQPVQQINARCICDDCLTKDGHPQSVGRLVKKPSGLLRLFERAVTHDLTVHQNKGHLRLKLYL